MRLVQRNRELDGYNQKKKTSCSKISCLKTRTQITVCFVPRTNNFIKSYCCIACLCTLKETKDLGIRYSKF